MKTTRIRVMVVSALVCATTLPVVAVEDASASGRTLYVAPDGSDGNPGTAGRPLLTPQAAVNQLRSGGTVVLAGGSYPRRRIVLNHRHDLTIRAASGAVPVLDGAGLAPVGGGSGLVEIRNSSNITVQGLSLTGYRTTSTAQTPMGIYVTGSGTRITLRGNHIHDLGNDNTTRGNMDINAHGIAVYGTNPKAAITHLTITGNEVDHLTLGASEALVVNGNVDGWAITHNRVHDDDNIGIDAIGYEETIGGKARYTDVDRARDGVISANTVTGITSNGNPAYWDGSSYCTCADGIYVDGGTKITVTGNHVRRADIGIEIAAENPRGKTNEITVAGNSVSDSAFVGLTVGGYAPNRGEAFDITVRGNTLRNDNTLDDGSPELLLQYKVHQATITGNTITATNADDPLLVQRVPEAGPASKNAGVLLDHNTYGAPVPVADAAFDWLGRDVTGLASWQHASGQDRHSHYVRR